MLPVIAEGACQRDSITATVAASKEERALAHALECILTSSLRSQATKLSVSVRDRPGSDQLIKVGVLGREGEAGLG